MKPNQGWAAIKRRMLLKSFKYYEIVENRP